MLKREAGWIVALLFVGVGALVYQQSLDMPGNIAQYTKALGVLLAVLSAILALREFRTARRAGGEGPLSREARGGYLMVVLVVVLTTAYIFLLPIIGYPYLTAGYFAVMMWMLGLRNLVLLPLVAAGGAFGMYYVFVKLLHVTLG